MVYGAHDAKLQTLLLARQPCKEGTLRVVGERTAECITHIVREGGYAVELPGIGFHRQLLHRIGTLACAPPLSINEYGRIYLVHRLAYLVHRLDVVDSHQVKTKTVYVILVYPVLHRLYHEAAHHGALRGGLIAATGTVGVGNLLPFPDGGCARLPSYWEGLGVGSIVIVWISLLEVGVLDVVGVIIYHIKDDTYACLVECLHHLLELSYATCGVVGIGTIRPVWHVIVHGVVAPVIFVLV